MTETMTQSLASSPTKLPALSPHHGAASSGSALARFFTWWGRELSALTPGLVKRALRPAPPALIASLMDGAVVLETRRRRRVDYLGPLAELKPKTLRRLKRAIAKRRLEVVLATTAENAVTRPITLPLAAEATLTDVLYYELDRVTPFHPRELYYDHRITRRAPEAARLQVEVVFAPRAVIDPALETLRAKGLSAARVDLRAPDGGLRGLNLLPKKSTGSKHLKRALGVALLAAALAACVAASWIGLAEMERHAEALRDEAFLARREAIAAQKRATQDMAQSDALVLAYEMKTGAPLAVEALALLTEALPDDAWIEALTIERDRIEMSGVSANATALFGLLEARPRFEAAEFRAPITHDGAGDSERFVLSVRLTPEGDAK